MLGTMPSDPILQVGIFGIVLGTIAVLLALRPQVGTHPGCIRIFLHSLLFHAREFVAHLLSVW